MATAHALAVVRAARPVLVKVAAGGETSLVFVNGERLGSSARRGSSDRWVELKQGENLFHLISSHRSGAWPIGFKLTVVDPVKPRGEGKLPFAK